MIRRASQWGALRFLTLLFLLAFAAYASAEPDCGAAHPQEKTSVRHVVDGDTVVLSDGRKVRIIGINAPEMARDERAAEPYAEKARDALIRNLDSSRGLVLIQSGAERLDRYGRSLAHLFTPDGQHLGASLVRQGLATAIAIPPNLAYQDCLRHAEQAARKKEIGIWRSERFSAFPAASLSARQRGFLRVQGRLDGVGFSRDSLWLQLDGRLGVRIHKSNLVHFRRWNFHALQGEEMVVRGWITHGKRGPRMELKHPNDLELLDPKAKELTRQ